MSEEQLEESLGVNEKVGDYIRRIREARGMELSQMAKAIRLSIEVLAAIEDSRWGYFKIEAYLRSYIVSICEKLSLDKNDVLRRLSLEMNSQSRTSLLNMIENPEEQEQKKAKSFPTVEIAIVLAVIAILFFVAKTLNSKTETSQASKPVEVEAEPQEEPSDSLSAEAEADSALASAEPPARALDSQDTLRFECTPSPTDNMCAFKLAYRDVKMVFFKRMETRYVNHYDTSNITITVPERTRLFVNNQRLDYGRFNTIFLHKGEVIKQLNREIR